MKLFNKYEKQIIELLLQKDSTLSEIAEKIKISKPTTSMYLKRLEQNGIIKGEYVRDHIGRRIRYSLQSFHIIFSIDSVSKNTINFSADTYLDKDFLFLGNISQKEFRSDVKEYLRKIIDSSLEEYMIILYGSVAQGLGNRKSDIDLLILKDEWLKEEQNKILELIAVTSKRCNHVAKPVFKSTKEFEKMDKSIQKEIIDHGIILYEKGIQWGRIKQQLRRYKTITI